MMNTSLDNVNQIDLRAHSIGFSLVGFKLDLRILMRIYNRFRISRVGLELSKT